ncbi:beta barrel domain-containing protein [Kitasatospora mediocidica]|uniref:beta barrel domain-containing protein n=1 Tax=Kitasatospora mediocidica TaxID=58352 RepID=UPI00055E6378|nr:hypothetical protein [Kitasatospora mediocidica]
MSKPELGKVAVDDQLIVIRPFNRYRADNAPIPAAVTKVGRIWIELAQVNQVRSQSWTWRMRLDTQNEGAQHSQSDRFVTAEQYAWEQRVAEANAYLREVDLVPGFKSPWYAEDRRLELANLLRRHDGLPEL